MLYSESSPSLACTGKKIETQTCVVNSALTDFKNHDSGRRTTFSSKTKVNFACKFFCLLRWFWSKEKNCSTFSFNISIIFVDGKLFLWWNWCHAGNCSPAVHVTLGRPWGLGKNYGDSVLWLLIMIIHVLNTISWVVVIEMVQQRHSEQKPFPSHYYKNVNNNAF